MAQFRIKGGSSLTGTIPVYGSKNAALPLLAATLLTPELVTLENIPPIRDVMNMLDILETIGVQYEHTDHQVTIQAEHITPEALPQDKVGLLRGSILLMGALLGRTRQAHLTRPGGDIIGARPIDVHLDAFKQLGAVITEEDSMVHIDGQHMQSGKVILGEFSVTATENVLLAAATLPGTTTIEIAAAEPHVVALADLLNRMGAKITGAGTHTIVVEGSPHLHGAKYTNIPDMLEAGFFILLAAVTQSTVTIENVPLADLHLFFKRLTDIGVDYTIDTTKDKQTVTVRPGRLKAFSLQTLPHPGIATDLQAPFAVIATQAIGSSLIHDPLYESRFRHVHELQKMGASVTVCDPHRVIIHGPTALYGKVIPSLDIRSGATLILAGLVASGETIIEQAEIIDRGYANLMERLVAIGAQITRVE